MVFYSMSPILQGWCFIVLKSPFLQGWCFIVLKSPFPQYLRNAWPTDPRTDPRTDRRTDKASYRDAWTHLKKVYTNSFEQRWRVKDRDWERFSARLHRRLFRFVSRLFAGDCYLQFVFLRPFQLKFRRQKKKTRWGTDCAVCIDGNPRKRLIWPYVTL